MKYKPRALQKRPLNLISVVVHDTQPACVLKNKNLSCCWGVPTVDFPLYPKASVRCQVAERKQFFRVTTVLFMPWWHCF